MDHNKNIKNCMIVNRAIVFQPISKIHCFREVFEDKEFIIYDGVSVYWFHDIHPSGFNVVLPAHLQLFFEIFNRLKHEHLCFIHLKLSVLLPFVLSFDFDYLSGIKCPLHGGDSVFALRDIREINNLEKIVHSTFITLPMSAFLGNDLGRLGYLLGTEN